MWVVILAELILINSDRCSRVLIIFLTLQDCACLINSFRVLWRHIASWHLANTDSSNWLIVYGHQSIIWTINDLTFSIEPVLVIIVSSDTLAHIVAGQPPAFWWQIFFSGFSGFRVILPDKITSHSTNGWRDLKKSYVISCVVIMVHSKVGKGRLGPHRHRKMKRFRACRHSMILMTVASMLMTFATLLFSLRQESIIQASYFIDRDVPSLMPSSKYYKIQGRIISSQNGATSATSNLLKRNVLLGNIRPSQLKTGNNRKVLTPIHTGESHDSIHKTQLQNLAIVNKNNVTLKMISKEDFEEIAYIQWRRRSQIQEVCRRTGPWSTDNLAPTGFYFLLADDKHKVIYCNVPKVASTMWTKIMLQMTGDFNQSFPGLTSLEFKPSDRVMLQRHGLIYLDSLSPAEAWARITKYYKFMFVRPPFERLLAVYNDKLSVHGKEYYQELYGKDIVKRYRKHSGDDDNRFQNIPTFGEFAHYISDLDKSRGHFDEHWMSYFKLCHPCLVKYDFIGKLETMLLDRAYVLFKGFGIQKNNLVANPPRTTDAMVHSEFAKLPIETIEKLRDVYKVDFLSFNYTLHLWQNYPICHL